MKPGKGGARRGPNEPCLLECSSGPDLCPTQGTSFPTRLNELNYVIRQRESNNIRFTNNTCFIMELGYKITKTGDAEHECRNKAQRAMEKYNP